ncbi:MAG: alpha/beta hydrolase fold domain-containing protein [Acidimicrobiia bacterium]
MTADSPPILPGRLGSPAMTLRDDPRADPRMIAAMEPFGLADPPEAAPVDDGSPIDALLEYVGAAEEGFEALFGALVSGLPDVEGITRSVEIIRGIDGNDITLFVHRPAIDDTDLLPGVLHLHGGGMVLLEAAGAAYVRWRDELAASGMVVVGVEFRNGGGKHGAHAFPAGLNDCSSALQWVIDNKAALGISKLVVSGESGGGNLTLATTLKAKRDGRLGQIDGVYAMCPYVSNAYAAPLPQLTSLHENDGYFLSCHMMGALAKVYDPGGEHAADPLAWPFYATADDLVGLPPHVISVNQLDPLRDEGLDYYRKLLDAGVSAVSRTVNGTCHAGDLIFRAAMPDVFAATVRDIRGFADSL